MLEEKAFKTITLLLNKWNTNPQQFLSNQFYFLWNGREDKNRESSPDVDNLDEHLTVSTICCSLHSDLETTKNFQHQFRSYSNKIRLIGNKTVNQRLTLSAGGGGCRVFFTLKCTCKISTNAPCEQTFNFGKYIV